MDNSNFHPTNQAELRQDRPDNIFSEWVYFLAKMNIDASKINPQQAIRYINIHNEEMRIQNELAEKTQNGK